MRRASRKGAFAQFTELSETIKLWQIFAHTIDEVGDKYYLNDKSARQEALMVLACQCLNVLRDSGSWVYK